MSKYTLVHTYTKKGNLIDFLYTDKVMYERYQGTIPEAAKSVYARERDIQLIAQFRFEPASNRIFCRIKCPVNPLPIKGEFEIPSISVFSDWLENNGWTFKHKISYRMFE